MGVGGWCFGVLGKTGRNPTEEMAVLRIGGWGGMCLCQAQWLMLCLGYYYFPRYGGVHWFAGPRANVAHGDCEEAGTLEEEKNISENVL